MSPFRQTAAGLDLFVRLTPRGGADRVDGLAPDADGGVRLAMRVRAVPEKGAANEALERLVAGLLGVPRRDVSVTAGHTARLKTVAVSGDPDRLAQKAAQALLQEGSPSPRH